MNFFRSACHKILYWKSDSKDLAKGSMQMKSKQVKLHLIGGRKPIFRNADGCVIVDLKRLIGDNGKLDLGTLQDRGEDTTFVSVDRVESFEIGDDFSRNSSYRPNRGYDPDDRD